MSIVTIKRMRFIVKYKSEEKPEAGVKVREK